MVHNGNINPYFLRNVLLLTNTMVLSSKFTREDENLFTLRLEERDIRPGLPVKVFTKYFVVAQTVRLHYHESLELNLCFNVRGTIWISGQAYDLSEHPVFVLAPRILHSYSIEPSSGKMEIIHIFPSFLGPWIDGAFYYRSVSALPPTCPLYDRDLRVLLEFIEKVKGFAEKPSHSCSLSSDILGLTAYLLQAKSRPWGDEPQLRRLIDWTEKNLSKAPDLSSAARELGMSRSGFCRWFSERVGSGYGRYVEELRLELAREYIVSGASVAQAATRVGYHDPSYFIRRFVKRYGFTPGAYRRSSKG
jgi:AraC-like DNA-binding protein/quercetin dioxygenase-like cupin family protein